MKRHHVELAYAQGHLYARCRCGWEGTRRPSPGGERSDAYWAAERDAVAHEHAPGSVGVPYGSRRADDP
ncbi:MAG: hypothetical protein ACRDYA_07895 [Egibacteraceae bacterium]